MMAEPGFSTVALVARVLLAAPYLVSGIEKSLHFQAALEEFTKARAPLLRFTTVATITLHFVGAICLITGWFAAEAAIALALFTAVATIRVHDFWNMEGEERLIRSRVALANYGLVGGLLLLAAVGPGANAL